MQPRSTTVVAAGVTVTLVAVALLLPGRAAPAHPSPAASTRPRSHQSAPPRISVSAGIELLHARNGGTFARIPKSSVRAPVEVFHEGGSFWVFDVKPSSFVQVDPATGDVIRRFHSPIADVGFFTVSGNTLWITDERGGAVTAVDASDGHRLRSFAGLPGRGGSVGVAVSHGSLWISRPEADGGNGLLLRLDPRTGHIERKMIGLPGSYAITTESDGTIWTAGTFGGINRIDPTTNRVVRGVTEGRNFSVAAGDGFGWTADGVRGVVYKVDGSGNVVAQYPTARGAHTVSYSDGDAWVGNPDNGTVTRIDASGRVITYRFDHRVLSLAAGSGAVLVVFGGAV